MCHQNILNSKLLIEFHYSMKSLIPIPEKRNDNATINLRWYYELKFRHLKTEYENLKFIFLQVGFSVVTRPIEVYLDQELLPTFFISHLLIVETFL